MNTFTQQMTAKAVELVAEAAVKKAVSAYEKKRNMPHPISNIIRWMLKESNTSIEMAAEYLGISTQALRNKLSRDTFSINDLFIIAFACNIDVTFSGKNNLTVKANDYIDMIDCKERDRVLSIDKIITKKKKEEYQKLKKQLEELESKYGFK